MYGKLIRKGSFTFLKKEYAILGIFALVVSMFILLFFPSPIWEAADPFINLYMVIVYLLGSIFSGLAGVIGISVATIANRKTAVMAQESLPKAFMAGFRGGRSNGNGSCWYFSSWCCCYIPYF